MLGLIIGAGILGIIIALMEQGEFPGWIKMALCVLAAGVPAAILDFLLPRELFFVGPLVGAVCATFAIMATCGMSLKRAGIAAGIYFTIQIALSLALSAMLRA